MDASIQSWGPGEPNNAGSGEHFVEVMTADGTWNDLPDNPGEPPRTVVCESRKIEFDRWLTVGEGF